MTTAHVILSAARDLYLETGLPGFSMRKLASRVGLSAAALYRHYDGKEALITAVIDEGFRLFTLQLMDALSGKTPRERLERAGLSYLKFGLENPGYYRMMFMATEADHGLSQIGRESPEKLSKAFLFLVDRVRECKDARVLAGPEPLELAAVLWSFWHGMVSLSLAGHFKPVLTNTADIEAFFARSSAAFITGAAP